jgi:hypothetical protein
VPSRTKAGDGGVQATPVDQGSPSLAALVRGTAHGGAVHNIRTSAGMGLATHLGRRTLERGRLEGALGRNLDSRPKMLQPYLMTQRRVKRSEHSSLGSSVRKAQFELVSIEKKTASLYGASVRRIVPKQQYANCMFDESNFVNYIDPTIDGFVAFELGARAFVLVVLGVEVDICLLCDADRRRVRLQTSTER